LEQIRQGDKIVYTGNSGMTMFK